MGIHFERGQALFDLGRYREAIEEYQLELAENPNCAVVHANIGAALYNCGEVAEAREAASKAAFIDPELPHSYHVLSYVHQARGEYYSARDAVFESLRLEPCADNYCRLAEIYAWNQDRDLTLEATASALSLDPEHVPSILLRGKKLIELGHREEAQQLFASAMSKSPEVAEAHHAMGILHLSSGDADEAMALLTEARRLDPLRVNDKASIAEAYGLNLPILRLVNRYAVRWHLWPFFWKWSVAMVLTIVFCLASLMISTPTRRLTASHSIAPYWCLFCVFLTNYLVLPYALPRLAKSVAMFFAKRKLDVSWWRIGFHLIGTVKALAMLGAASLLGLGFSGVPELAAMAFAVSTCFPLVIALARARTGRLVSFLCLPLLIVLSFSAVIGISSLVYIEMPYPAGMLGWVPILIFFAIAFFSEKFATWASGSAKVEPLPNT